MTLRPKRQHTTRLFPASLLVSVCCVFVPFVTTQACFAQATDEQATEAGSEVTMDQVRKLLRELEGDSIQERDAAEKGLIQLGPQALPFLPQVTARTSGELKIRLQRIRQSVEAVSVENFFEASMVTLTGKMNLPDAIDSLQKQSGNAIVLRGGEAFDSTEVEIDASEQPFWTVLENIMDQANLRINAFGTTDNELVLTSGGRADDEMGSYMSGPFRVEVSSVQSSLPFNSTIGGQLQVSLQVAWEPRLKPVFMQIPMSATQATLVDGELASINPQAMPEIPLNLGGCTTQIDLQLERPSRDEKKLQTLSGEFVVAVPSATHQYKFTKFGNGARQAEKFGDVNVILEGSRRNGAVYEMRVLVEFGNAQGALDSFRGWILSNKAYLLDGNEQRVANVGLQTYAVTSNAVGIAYLFQINGDPNDFTLVYESPASMSKQKVSYELKNIPLP